MAEAKLSPTEVAEFKTWLGTKSREQGESKNGQNRQSGENVGQYIGWVKDRMTNSKVDKK